MDLLEKVEKVREKTGVSYEVAKEALEACEYDMLEALVYLEKQGKIPQPSHSTWSTEQGQHSEAFHQTQETYARDCQKKSSGDTWRKFTAWCKKMLKASLEKHFEVIRENRQVLSVPVLILMIGFVCAFWVTLPLLIIGMFMGCRYQFSGFEKTSIDLNEMCEKASEACEQVKKNFQEQKDAE